MNKKMIKKDNVKSLFDGIWWWYLVVFLKLIPSARFGYFLLTDHKQTLHQHVDKTTNFKWYFWCFDKMWVNTENAVKNDVFGHSKTFKQLKNFTWELTFKKSSLYVLSLTHYSLVLFFYTPWKHQKT